MRIDLVGTTADFQRLGHPQPLPINHLLCENRRTQGRMGEVGLGGRLRSSKVEFLKVGGQGDANRLKELTSDARGRGAQQEALAILLKLDFLQPVEIAQDVVPFGCDVVRCRRSSSSLTSSRARKEQNTWPRMAMSLLW